MGIRGEIFSTKVHLENRTYFFNVKENRLGDLYLNIVESKNKDTGGFERQSIVLFAEDLKEFLKGFDESLRVLEKAYKEQQRQGREKSSDKAAIREKPRTNPGEEKRTDNTKKAHVRIKKEGAKSKSSESFKNAGSPSSELPKTRKRAVQVRPIPPKE